jgi:transcriptional antiterminator RfaH
MQLLANVQPAAFEEPAWFCLRSQPKHEHIAAGHLRRVDGVFVFCPRIRFKRATGRGAVWVTEALFPGYLFARFRLAEHHRLVRYSSGIRDILRFGNRYATIEEHILHGLWEGADVTETKEVDSAVAAGDSVKIIDGAFTGLEAVVTQVLPAKQRVKVLMDFLGRKMEADVENSRVLRQVVHPLAA